MQNLLVLLLTICFVFTLAISFSSCAPKATDKDTQNAEEVQKAVGEESPEEEALDKE
ncbi:MAG: hypothetical protein QMD92_04860 [bacterium]|nr:hypothetical protein [bacterium]